MFFSLDANGLTVRYEVRNAGNEHMLFTLGSHPAFSLPITNSSLEDYYLEFELAEQLDCYFLDKDLLCTKPIPAYLNNSKTIPISAKLFENDALIFKNIQSRKVSIHHQKTGKRLTLDLGQAPHFGIWAKAGAPFICLEPWFSFDDTAVADGNLVNKPGMLSLPSGETFTTNYRIVI